MKTIEQDFEEWLDKHPSVWWSDMDRHNLNLMFLDAYERGHAAASQHCLSSIAKAFTPEPA